jgi:hypothetical protein
VDGLKGCASMFRDANVAFGPPNGGNGGNGGDVVLRADHNVTDLQLEKKNFKAASGTNGMGSDMHGARGETMELRVPCGTLVERLGLPSPSRTSRMEPPDAPRTTLAELLTDGDSILVARGGRVLTQSPQTCAAESMPLSVTAAGLSRASMSPESTIRLRGSVSTGSQRIGESARDDLPGDAPPVLAPSARMLLAAIADDGIPVSIRLLLILRGDLEGECLAVSESRSAIEAETRDPHHRELHGEHVAGLA